MIDFATLQGLTIPEGVVTQITDESGRVIWAVANNAPVVLQVEKITSDTYAGETTYTGEQFILLDIYPKTNGTVNVTYGGLTKTITDTSGAAEPNAQQVFFGTLYGVSDSVETPANGTLTIEGDYYAFNAGTFGTNDKGTSSKLCNCIYELVDLGVVTKLPHLFSFYPAGEAWNKITSVPIPKTVRSIGLFTMSQIPISSIYYLGSMSEWCNIVSSAMIGLPDYDGGICLIDFYINDKVVTNLIIPDNENYIYPYKFSRFSLTSVTIHDHVTTISHHAFYKCIKLESVTFANPTGWYITEEDDEGNTTKIALDLSDPVNNATLISSTYGSKEWKRE